MEPAAGRTIEVCLAQSQNPRPDTEGFDNERTQLATTPNHK